MFQTIYADSRLIELAFDQIPNKLRKPAKHTTFKREYVLSLTPSIKITAEGVEAVQSKLDCVLAYAENEYKIGNQHELDADLLELTAFSCRYGRPSLVKGTTGELDSVFAAVPNSGLISEMSNTGHCLVLLGDPTMYWTGNDPENSPKLERSPFEKISDIVMEISGLREQARINAGLQSNHSNVWRFPDFRPSGIAGGGISELIDCLIYLDSNLPKIRVGELSGLAQVRARFHTKIKSKGVKIIVAYPFILSRGVSNVTM
jgi:hypothetical protein